MWEQIKNTCTVLVIAAGVIFSTIILGNYSVKQPLPYPTPSHRHEPFMIVNPAFTNASLTIKEHMPLPTDTEPLNQRDLHWFIQGWFKGHERGEQEVWQELARLSAQADRILELVRQLKEQKQDPRTTLEHYITLPYVTTNFPWVTNVMRTRPYIETTNQRITVTNLNRLQTLPSERLLTNAFSWQQRLTNEIERQLPMHRANGSPEDWERGWGIQLAPARPHPLAP